MEKENVLIRLTRDQVWYIICDIDGDDDLPKELSVLFYEAYQTMDKDEKIEVSLKKGLDS